MCGFGFDQIVNKIIICFGIDCEADFSNLRVREDWR
jgi:hypothetical protein